MAKSKPKSTSVKSQPAKFSPPAWPLDDKRTFLLYAAVTIVLTLILFSRYLFGPNLFIFNDIGSDTLTIFYPNLVQNARYFEEVGMPGWSFYIGLGTNFYPGYLINPFQWIFLPMGPESIAYSIAWVQAFVLVATGLVFYRFLREALFSPALCFFGSLMYAFGGYLVLGDTWYGHAYAVFWMTVSFLGFELLLRRKIWWLFPIPFIFTLGTRGYFLILFMTVYALVRMLDVYGPSLLKVIQGYKRMLICGAIAVLFAFPFIGGQWQIIANSPRVAGSVSHAEKLSGKPIFELSNAKHNVTAILRTFSNDALGTGTDYTGWRNYLEAPSFYLGLITLLFFFQFFAIADKRRKWIYGSFMAFWLFIILFPWFRYAFYAFAGNYYKGALSLFIPFSFFFIGLLGFQEILSGKRLNKWILFASLFVLLGLLWYPYNVKDLVVSVDVQLKATIFLIGYTFLLWLFSEGGIRKIFYPALGIAMCAELLLFAWPTINNRVAITKADITHKNFHFDDSMEAVARIKAMDKDTFYRIDKVYGSIKTGYNDGMVQDFFGSKMYQSYNPQPYVEFLDKLGIIDGSLEPNTRWLVGLSMTNVLHGLFSIKYLLSTEETKDRVDPVIYAPVDSIGKTIISRNNFYIPFGIPFDQYISSASFDQYSDGQKKRSLYFGLVAQEDADWKKSLAELPESAISNDGAVIQAQTNQLAAKAMKMEYFSHNNIIGTISLEKPSVVFFSIPFDKGWKVTDNAIQKDLSKVNVGFTGLFLEPGKHLIELTYEPPLAKWGWLGVLGGLFLVLLLIRFKKHF